MMRLGRIGSPIAIACVLLLFLTSSSYPSYNSEASRKYGVACERLDGLKKSKRKKYRSYWMDCVRNFELVEKKYPKSPSAGDACFERAGLYVDMYQVSRWRKDITIAVGNYQKCLKKYPRHRGTPKALYDLIELQLDYRKDKRSAGKTYARLSRDYPTSKWTKRASTRLGLSPHNKKKNEQLRLPRGQKATPGSMGVVNGIRYRSSDKYTRVVIDVNQPFTFKSYELKNPDRLVFDIKNARISAALERDPVPINDGILRRIRYSQFKRDTVRVVFDLGSLESYNAFPLKEHDRLVIDVSGTTEGISQKSRQSQVPSGTSTQTHDIRKAREVAAGLKKSNIPLSQQLGFGIKTIAIDAGHGGHDPGAIGKRGLKEKKVTLDISRRLARLVKNKLGLKVILTRDTDEFIELEDRPAIAETKGADLFISIHTNANRSRRMKGIETYIQGLQATDQSAMETAALENATSMKKLSELDDELKQIFADLRWTDNDKESVNFAGYIQSALVKRMRQVNRYAVDLGVKRAFFYVLTNNKKMPSILAEVGFISNPHTERLLRRSAYRQRIAEALFQGIKMYLENRTPVMADVAIE